MHKFFFAPAVCANKKIPSQCKLRNIFSQLWIPTLPDRWPGSNWETGKAWVEGTHPDPHSTPSPPLSYKSHKSTGDKSKTAQSTNSPEAGKGGKLTQKCQLSMKTKIPKKKMTNKLETLLSEHLWGKLFGVNCVFEPKFIPLEQYLCPRGATHLVTNSSLQISNWRDVHLVSEVAIWAAILKVEIFEIPRLWIPIRGRSTVRLRTLFCSC